MKDKMQIEVKHDEDALKAFEDLIGRVTSGESVLEGMEFHGFPEEDVVVTVRWLDDGVAFERGPMMDEFDLSDLRQLALALIRQGGMLLDMADAQEKAEREADEE
jgi:hypothetical protein